MAGDRREVVILCDKYTDSIRKLQTTIKQLQIDAKIVVLEEHSFLPQGVNSLFEYFIPARNGPSGCQQQNQKDHEEKGLQYDSLEIPEFWNIEMQGNQGSIYELGCKRGSIYLKEPAEQGIVQRVEWQTEDGWVYRNDSYNKYGFKYASEFLDADGNVESKVYYSDKNQEVIVRHPQNDVVMLLEHGEVKRFFNSYQEFLTFGVKRMADGGKCIVFVQEETCSILDMEKDGENIWDAVLFFHKEVLERYRDRNGEKGYLFYAIPEAYSENHVSRNALILTASDQIEKLEEIIQELPEVTIHIAAHTQVSDKLQKLAECKNVRVYPGISERDLAQLWDKCDFYLDLNNYREIDDAVNEASQRNLLLMGFENTLHQRELLIRGCIFSPEDYKKMAYVIRYLIRDPALMQKFLNAQQRRRKEMWSGFLEEMGEAGQ